MTDRSEETPRRLAITGSCVARDTAEFAGAETVSVTMYAARQSLISSWSDASAHFPDDAEIASPFQERMIRDDFAGNLEERLRSLQGTDGVWWDIVDERHGVHELADGTYVTRSNDALAVPRVKEVIETGRLIAFGTAEHYALWSLGAGRLVDLLRELELLDRTTVLQVPWASRTLDGAETPASFGVTAREANRRALPYYTRLRALGVEVVDMPEERVVADPAHRWGLAPFHYSPSVYRELLERLG